MSKEVWLTKDEDGYALWYRKPNWDGCMNWIGKVIISFCPRTFSKVTGFSLRAGKHGIAKIRIKIEVVEE